MKSRRLFLIESAATAALPLLSNIKIDLGDWSGQVKDERPAEMATIRPRDVFRTMNIAYRPSLRNLLNSKDWTALYYVRRDSMITLSWLSAAIVHCLEIDFELVTPLNAVPHATHFKRNRCAVYPMRMWPNMHSREVQLEDYLQIDWNLRRHNIDAILEFAGRKPVDRLYRDALIIDSKNVCPDDLKEKVARAADCTVLPILLSTLLS